jgi:hypothetical protein
MSIASMTEVAFQSRTDVGSSKYFPKTFTEIAGAAGGKGTPESQVNAAFRTLTTYIPTETLTLYVAVLAALQLQPCTKSPVASPCWAVFWWFLLATPLVIWLVYITKARSTGRPIPWAPWKWPLWEMAAGTIAYVAWAFSLPNTPFALLEWYSTGLAGIVVLITSTVLGLLAPLFARPLKP